ncbi:hypothetical protein DL96DRAFT_773630 [Flagelloscypha sp. PMI_526]|nr:hypothetical protein DL96DRAFT_773630 [Flagelloscypha sp. PMI_526]
MKFILILPLIAFINASPILDEASVFAREPATGFGMKQESKLAHAVGRDSLNDCSEWQRMPKSVAFQRGFRMNTV